MWQGKLTRSGQISWLILVEMVTWCSSDPRNWQLFQHTIFHRVPYENHVSSTNNWFSSSRFLDFWKINVNVCLQQLNDSEAENLEKWFSLNFWKNVKHQNNYTHGDLTIWISLKINTFVAEFTDLNCSEECQQRKF